MLEQKAKIIIELSISPRNQRNIRKHVNRDTVFLFFFTATYKKHFRGDLKVNVVHNLSIGQVLVQNSVHRMRSISMS